MRTTRESEAESVAWAEQGVLDARADMARLHEGSGAAPSPEAQAMEAEYVRLAERRAADAHLAQERGERRREGRAHWRRVFGVRPMGDDEGEP